MERIMTTIQKLILSTALALGIAASALAGVNDPEVIIYRFTGVRDDGSGTNLGVATVFHCTNFSGVTENIRLVTRNNNTALESNVLIQIGHLATKTAATHFTAAYGEDQDLATGALNQGSTAIAATSINIICTAETIDASSAVPIGVARRGIRFSPVPGSQE